MVLLSGGMGSVAVTLPASPNDWGAGGAVPRPPNGVVMLPQQRRARPAPPFAGTRNPFGQCVGEGAAQLGVFHFAESASRLPVLVQRVFVGLAHRYPKQ